MPSHQHQRRCFYNLWTMRGIFQMEMLSKYKIKLLESPIPPLSVCLSSVTKKRWPLSATLHIFPRRVTKTLAGFSLGLIKADDAYDNFSSNSVLRGSHGLSARRAQRTKSSRPDGPKSGPKGP